MIGARGVLGTRRYRGPESKGALLAELVGERVAPRKLSGPRPTPLPLMRPAPGRPACTGLEEMFDSVQPGVITRARQVCAVCPVQDWCDQERRHAVEARLPIEGTWAGVAYAAGTALGTGVADV